MEEAGWTHLGAIHFEQFILIFRKILRQSSVLFVTLGHCCFSWPSKIKFDAPRTLRFYLGNNFLILDLSAKHFYLSLFRAKLLLFFVFQFSTKINKIDNHIGREYSTIINWIKCIKFPLIELQFNLLFKKNKRAIT